VSEQRSILVDVNRSSVTRNVSVRESLADFLRDELGLNGTRLGCEHGVCGACTVVMNGEPIRSCIVLAVQADGAHVTTIEGLVADGEIERLRSAFARHYAAQCGFCTSGMLVSAYCLLARQPKAREAQVRTAISGNLCRCTGYGGIVAAILESGAG
jgi:carbon-monoxide dehydrogenase small subunit